MSVMRMAEKQFRDNADLWQQSPLGSDAEAGSTMAMIEALGDMIAAQQKQINALMAWAKTGPEDDES